MTTIEPTPATAEVRLTILLSPSGQVRLEGPLNNIVLCYGILELTKDSLRDYQRQLAAGRPALEVLERPGLLVPGP